MQEEDKAPPNQPAYLLANISCGKDGGEVRRVINQLREAEEKENTQTHKTLPLTGRVFPHCSGTLCSVSQS